MYRVELLGNCNAQSPPTVEDYLKKAIKILVFNIALNNGGNVTLRRRMPPCWKRVGNILIPCNFQNCCVKEYVMAYDPPASVRVVSVTPPQSILIAMLYLGVTVYVMIILLQIHLYQEFLLA
jgi:hypothetical protein